MRILNGALLALVLSIPAAAFATGHDNDKAKDIENTEVLSADLLNADNAQLNLDEGSADEWRGGRGRFGFGRGWGWGGIGSWGGLGCGGGWGGGWWGGFFPYWGYGCGGYPFYFGYPWFF